MTRTAGPSAPVAVAVLSALKHGSVSASGRAEGDTWLRIAVNYLLPYPGRERQ